MRPTLALAALLLLDGCAALDPVDGYAPEELAHCLTAPIESRDANRTIDLSRLAQRRPSEHLVGAGDTLGVFVESFLGEEEKNPLVIAPATDRQKPRLGFPIVVGRDGTIRLPSLEQSLHVAGLPVPAVERLVREAYEDPETGVIRPGEGRIIVQLQAPRTTRVMVIRRDRITPEDTNRTPNEARTFQPSQGGAQLVELPAFENDVLHALTLSGGLPGPEAENAVYIMRADRGSVAAVPPAAPRPTVAPEARPETLPAPKAAGPSLPTPAIRPVGFRFGGGHSFGDACDFGCDDLCDGPCDLACDAGCSAFGCGTGSASPQPPTGTLGGHSLFGTQPQPAAVPLGGHSLPSPHAIRAAEVFMNDDPASLRLAQSMLDSPHVVRIPLETPCGTAQAFDPSDVILHDGDVVFIESREREFFYTAGLLGGGKYALPRGESLDVLDALALVDAQRRQLPGKYVGGVSSVSQDVTVGASKLVIYRRTAGRTVPIELNLNRVKKNPDTAIAIRPGDRLFLQYTPWQAIGAAFERHFLEGSVLGLSSAAAFSN